MPFGGYQAVYEHRGLLYDLLRQFQRRRDATLNCCLRFASQIARHFDQQLFAGFCVTFVLFCGKISADRRTLGDWRAVLVLEWRLAFSRLPVNRVLFEVGVNGAAYRRIEVGGAEAFE
jgi:hypothetical protein